MCTVDNTACIMFGVNRFVNELFWELEPLFQMDPLLVFAVVHVCSRYHITDLCANIALPYAIALVAHKLGCIQQLKGNTEVSKNLINSNKQTFVNTISHAVG